MTKRDRNTDAEEIFNIGGASVARPGEMAWRETDLYIFIIFIIFYFLFLFLIFISYFFYF